MPTYQGKDGRWRFRLQHSGRRYSGSTTKAHNTKAAAKALEKALVEKLERHVYTGKMPTVAVFVERFLDHQAGHTAQLTRKGQREHLTLHVVPELGRELLDAVTVMRVDGLKALWRSQGAARTTINTRLDTLQRMLALAAEWGYLAKAPKLKRLPSDHEDDGTPRFLNDAEGALLIEHALPQWKTMILIALRTGLRIGELRGLQWGDVNLSTRSIRVARTDPGVRGMEANSPKSGKGRTVPMTPDAFRCLSEMFDKQGAKAWVWPAGEWRGKKRHRPRSQSGCFQAIADAAKRAGLQDVGWHTLRHSYASGLVMRGKQLKAIQELLGHASIRQTEVYAHLAPGFANHELVADLDIPLMTTPTRPALPPGDAANLLPKPK